MNPDLQHLLELQQADREIARLRQEIASLPKRIAAVEEKLASARAQLEGARGQLKTGESTRRKHEAEIQSLQQKISKYREQSLDVKTNDQYKALLHEISFAEKAIRDAEDAILETMVRAEDYEKTVRSAEAELKSQTAIIEKEKAEVRARTEQDEKELAELVGQRETLRSQITENVLLHYDRVSKLRGSGVAEVKGNHCGACNVGLRPQVLNDLMTNEQVITCSSCGRILVYPEQPTGEAPAADLESYTVERAWYFSPNYGSQGAFLAFVNAKGSTSRRIYDAVTGSRISKQRTKNATFKEAFRNDIEGSRLLELEQQPNLEEECDEQLPASILTELQAQVDLAQTSA